MTIRNETRAEIANAMIRLRTSDIKHVPIRGLGFLFEDTNASEFFFEMADKLDRKTATHLERLKLADRFEAMLDQDTLCPVLTSGEDDKAQPIIEFEVTFNEGCNKLIAIRDVRNTFGVSLGEAKSVVEAARDGKARVRCTPYQFGLFMAGAFAAGLSDYWAYVTSAEVLSEDAPKVFNLAA